MKKIIFSFLLIASFSINASVSIVSDLDDTIKITNSGDEVDGALNGAFSTNVFTGISFFFLAMRSEIERLHILTASPPILKGKILETLKKNGVQIDSLTLKDPLRRQSKLEYKVNFLTKLLDESNDSFILMGDDVGQDPEAYDKIKKLYPERILAIYIHVIKARIVPSSVVSYWTSQDILLREYLAGRIVAAKVEKSFDLMLNETEIKFIFPHFAECPKENHVFLWQLETMFRAEALLLMEKLRNYCLMRT